MELQVEKVLNRLPVTERKLLEGIYIEIKKKYLSHEYSNEFYMGMLEYSCDAILFRALNTIFTFDKIRGLTLNTKDERYLKDKEKVLRLQGEYFEVSERLNKFKATYNEELIKICNQIKSEALRA